MRATLPKLICWLISHSYSVHMIYPWWSGTCDPFIARNANNLNRSIIIPQFAAFFKTNIQCIHRGHWWIWRLLLLCVISFHTREFYCGIRFMANNVDSLQEIIASDRDEIMANVILRLITGYYSELFFNKSKNSQIRHFAYWYAVLFISAIVEEI